jgi:hypothetical protein
MNFARGSLGNEQNFVEENYHMVPVYPDCLSHHPALCAAAGFFLRLVAAHGSLSAVRRRLRSGTPAEVMRNKHDRKWRAIASKRNNIDMLRNDVPHFSPKTRLNPEKSHFTKALVALKRPKKYENGG